MQLLKLNDLLLECSDPLLLLRKAMRSSLQLRVLESKVLILAVEKIDICKLFLRLQGLQPSCHQVIQPLRGFVTLHDLLKVVIERLYVLLELYALFPKHVALNFRAVQLEIELTLHLAHVVLNGVLLILSFKVSP